MRKLLVILLVLLSPTIADAKWSFLDTQSIHPNPTANPRTPISSFLFSTSLYKNKRLIYGDAALGNSFSLLTWHGRYYPHLQLGLEAGCWATLLWLEQTSFLLLTTDFSFSLPLRLRWGAFSAALKFNHISAHLGDGMETLQQQAMDEDRKKTFDFYGEVAEANDTHLHVTNPIAYSRDFFSLHVRYDLYLQPARVIFHGRTGYLHKTIPDELKRWFVGMGYEARKRGDLPLYTALDMQWNQGIKEFNIAAQTGVILTSTRDELEMRIAFIMYRGRNKYGQLYRDSLREYSIGFMLK